MPELMSLEQLLALPDAETVTEVVDLSAFGLGAVRIRQFSVAQARAIYEDAAGTGTDDMDRYRDRLDTLTLARGIVDPAMTEEQAATLLQKQHGPVQHLLNAIRRLSGLTALMQLSAQAVDDAERRFRRQ